MSAMAENNFLDHITHPDAQQYAEEHTSPESDTLHHLDRWTHLKMPYPQMLSGHYQGKLLEFISLLKKPHHILEIGSYVGYSTVCLSKGLDKDGKIHCIEANEEYEDIIKDTLQKSGIAHKTTLHIGDATHILPMLEGIKFDLVFIDADKKNYLNYYETIVPMLRNEGLLLIDNVLWSGKVLYPQSAGDKETEVLKQLNDRVQTDPRVENILLTIRDGLMMCVKL